MFTLGIDAQISRKEKTGVEWYTHHLVQAMKKITPPDWRVFLYSMETLPWPPKRGWGQIRLSWEMLRQPPNVLFIPHSMIPFLHPRNARAKQFTVTTIHDVGYLEHSKLYAPEDLRRQRIALNLAKQHAARIFVPSESTSKNLVQLAGVEESRIVVTPLGIDHAHYRPIEDPGAVLAKYSLNKPYFLYVGRIDAKKNLPTLVQAFDQINGFELILVGSQGFGAEKIAGENVRLLNWVPEEDLPGLYAGATAFVFPSAYEGFGLPVLQALACGVPTIASDIPALREVAGQAALFVKPNDVAGWTDALRRITHDNDLRNHLQAQGLAQAKNFSWQKCAERTWEEIRSLV